MFRPKTLGLGARGNHRGNAWEARTAALAPAPWCGAPARKKRLYDRTAAARRALQRRCEGQTKKRAAERRSGAPEDYGSWLRRSRAAESRRQTAVKQPNAE